MSTYRTIDLNQYQAAKERAVYYPIPAAGILRVSGVDKLNFLQRQSTNDLRLIKPGKSIFTVLTSPTARILDLLCVFYDPDAITGRVSDPAIVVITLPGYADLTSKYLKSRIFFMDKVSIAEHHADYICFDLFGSLADKVLLTMGLHCQPSEHQVFSIKYDHIPLWIIQMANLVSPGFRLVIPAQEKDRFLKKLESISVSAIDETVYECLRIEAGLPAPGHELIQDFTPLEVGLDKAISDAKGCYTGQEVIARQITYQKVNRFLVGIRLKEPVEPGTPVKCEDREIGKITSIVISPAYGTLALAVIKRINNQTLTLVQVAGSDSEVVDLPFS